MPQPVIEKEKKKKNELKLQRAICKYSGRVPAQPAGGRAARCLLHLAVQQGRRQTPTSEQVLLLAINGELYPALPALLSKKRTSSASETNGPSWKLILVSVWWTCPFCPWWRLCHGWREHACPECSAQPAESLQKKNLECSNDFVQRCRTVRWAAAPSLLLFLSKLCRAL